MSPLFFLFQGVAGLCRDTLRGVPLSHCHTWNLHAPLIIYSADEKDDYTDNCGILYYFGRLFASVSYFLYAREIIFVRSFLDVKNDYFIENLEILWKPDFQTCLCKRSQRKTSIFAKCQHFANLKFSRKFTKFGSHSIYDFAGAFERWRKSQPSHTSPEKLILSENKKGKKQIGTHSTLNT
jgi:hypothetical protein